MTRNITTGEKTPMSVSQVCHNVFSSTIIFHYLTSLQGYDGDCPQCGPRGPSYIFSHLRCIFREATHPEVPMALPLSNCYHQELMLLRNTPIGLLHRAMWIHIPNGLQSVDQWLTNGRLSASVVRVAYTLWNDRHPTVMVRGTGPYGVSFISSCYSTVRF
jgi:hypothetical protein